MSVGVAEPAAGTLRQSQVAESPEAVAVVGSPVAGTPVQKDWVNPLTRSEAPDDRRLRWQRPKTADVQRIHALDAAAANKIPVDDIIEIPVVLSPK